MNTSVKRVTKEKFAQEIEDDIVSGWKLKSKNENIAILEKYDGWGAAGSHIIVFLCTFFWIPIFGNIIYAGYAHWASRSELHIKAENQDVTL